MKVIELRQWLTTKRTSSSWPRVVMHLLPQFREAGFYFQDIKDEQDLNGHLLKLIDQTVQELYQLHIPKP